MCSLAARDLGEEHSACQTWNGALNLCALKVACKRDSLVKSFVEDLVFADLLELVALWVVQDGTVA